MEMPLLFQEDVNLGKHQTATSLYGGKELFVTKSFGSSANCNFSDPLFSQWSEENSVGYHWQILIKAIFLHYIELLIVTNLVNSKHLWGLKYPVSLYIFRSCLQTVSLDRSKIRPRNQHFQDSFQGIFKPHGLKTITGCLSPMVLCISSMQISRL